MNDKFGPTSLSRVEDGTSAAQFGVRTVVLATAVAFPDMRQGIDFFPLTVNYREFIYAGGRNTLTGAEGSGFPRRIPVQLQSR